MTTRAEQIRAVALAALMLVSMVAVGLSTAPAAVAAENATEPVADDFEAYDTGTLNPGPWTVEDSGDAPSEVVDDSLLGDRALTLDAYDASAEHTDSMVDTDDFVVDAVIRGVDQGGNIEFGDTILEYDTGEFTDRLRLYDGDTEEIVEDAGNPEDEWVNLRFVGEGGDLWAYVWDIGDEQPDDPDITLDDVDDSGELVFTAATDSSELYVDDVALQEFSALGSDTVAGTITDQHGEPLDGATVRAVGVAEPAITGDDPADQAETLLDDLEDPLPDAFDPDLEPGDAVFGDADSEYAAVHTAGAWDMDGFELGDRTVTASITPALDAPAVTHPADEQLVISVWDPADTGTVQDDVDGALPGATTSGDVRIEQLGPTGETTDTRTVETEPLVDVTSAWNLGTKTHEAAVVDLPPGVYRVHPEDSPEAAYVVTVGDPDELASGFAEDLRDDADQLTDRAAEIQDLRDDDGLVTRTAETDADGQYAVDVPSNVEVVRVQAFGADGDLLDAIEEPSLGDVRDAYADGYNGTIYLSDDAARVTPPEQNADLTLTRLDAPPWAGTEAFADRIDAWVTDRLDERLADLTPGPGDLPDAIGDEDLADLHDDLTELRDQNDDLADRIDERVADLADPDTAPDDAIREDVEAMHAALEDLQQTVDASDAETALEDGLLDHEVTLDAGLPAEALTVTATYEDGTTERIPDEYVSVADEGLLSGSTTVTIDDYPVPDGTEVADVRVRGATADELVDVRERGLSDGAEDLADLDAITVSTLSPGPDEAVTMGVEASDAQTSVTDVEAFGPDGSAVETGVDDGRDQATFRTDGEGVHRVAVTVEQAGIEVTESLRVEAGANSQSDAPTVRLSEGPSGTYAVTTGLESARVEATDGELAITAIAEGDTAPGRVHIHPQAVMSGSTDRIDVDVQTTDAESAARHVSVAIHATHLDEDALVWRGDDAVTRNGDTRFGEVDERDDAKFVINSYTDADGEVTMQVGHDPSVTERLQHWAAANAPFSLPG